MAKVGYIMIPGHYDYLEEDRKWMNDYGCVNIFEEKESNERTRPLWKQLTASLHRGDELVISKFSNALRGSREFALFLEFCRIKVIRIISIHDKIDTKDELFPILSTAALLEIVGSLPEEAFTLRSAARHYMKLKEKTFIFQTDTTPSKIRRIEREKTIINMYASGHSIDEIWKASGFSSRSSIFRILNKNNIQLNRGSHSGPIKKRD